jgi:hypothetical protein
MRYCRSADATAHDCIAESAHFLRPPQPRAHRFSVAEELAKDDP